MKTKNIKLIPGELYSDLENADSEMVTILRFVKKENGANCFEYVRGVAYYTVSDNGFIEFPLSEEFYRLKK